MNFSKVKMSVTLMNFLKVKVSFTLTNVFHDFRLYDSSDLKTYLLMRWQRADALAVVRPTGVYLLDFFCLGIQFYLLLSPYLCFISFLYLDFYVLGDEALIS